MKLYISSSSLEKAYPDLYEASQLQARRLYCLQSMVLAEFPEYYKQLPDTLEHYLQLRSLFALIEALWVRLAKQYKSARKSLEDPCEQIPDEVINLKSMLIEIQAMPLESFVSKTKDGLLDLEKLVKEFSETLGFIVIKPNMWFDDLIGMVKNYGISYPGILNLALSDSYYPKGVTIGDNLEKLSLLQKIQHDLMTITQRNLMFFDTDEEFADFVFQPYAVFSEKKGQLSYDGAYSEQYLRAVKDGKKFVIMKGSSDSAVNRRKVVSKRVLVPEELGSSRKDVCVSLPVENLSDGFIDL